jgi:hypothetical protein
MQYRALKSRDRSLFPCAWLVCEAASDPDPAVRDVARSYQASAMVRAITYRFRQSIYHRHRRPRPEGRLTAQPDTKQPVRKGCLQRSC